MSESNTIEIGTLVVVEGRDGFWTVTKHEKGWFTVTGTDEDGTEVEAKVRAKALEIVPDVEETDEEAAKSMSKTLNAYKPNYLETVAYSGAKSLNNGDIVAEVLAGIEPGHVALLADRVMGESDGFHAARYEALNPGQIRMNSGNRIRAAVLKREEVPMEDFLKAARGVGIDTAEWENNDEAA